MPALQQNLVVEGFPLGVVSQRHGELTQAGHKVLGHPLLVGLWAPGGVFQLITFKDGTQPTDGRYPSTAVKVTALFREPGPVTRWSKTSQIVLSGSPGREVAS